MTNTLHQTLVFALIGLAGVPFLALCFVVAPYGRHTRAGWGPTLPDRVGWILMESPALFFFVWLYARGAHRGEAAPLALLALWVLHYGHRTLVYPLRQKSRGKRMPAVVALMAIGFNVLNAEVNAPQIAELGSYPDAWLGGPQFLVGASLFLAGFVANVDADRRLFALRRPGETAYAVPHGGLYELVSCPNYLAEIVEWIGWAIATWSLAGFAFALYTAANLAPRALAHDAWYRARFPDYPKTRKALIPYMF